MKRNYILFNFVSPKPYKGTTLQEMFTTCFLNAWNPCDHACVVASLHSAQIKARILKAPRKVLHLVEANLRKVSGEKQKVFIDSKIYEHRSMKNNFYFWAAWQLPFIVAFFFFKSLPKFRKDLPSPGFISEILKGSPAFGELLHVATLPNLRFQISDQ